MDITSYFPLIIGTLCGIIAGFAFRGWLTYQEATAKARLLKVAASALSQLSKLNMNADTVAAAQVQAAIEAAQLASLKAQVAAL